MISAVQVDLDVLAAALRHRFGADVTRADIVAMLVEHASGPLPGPTNHVQQAQTESEVVS